MRSRKSVAKRNDFESVLLRWIIKFNIREERLVELLSVAEKIWPAQLEAKISESCTRILLNFRLEERETKSPFNHLAQVLVVCLAQKVSKLGWREFIEWKDVVWSLRETLLVGRFDNSRDFFSFCWSERVDFFPSACDVIRWNPFFFFSNCSVNKSSKKRCNFFFFSFREEMHVRI